ncbi:WD domain-containing protein, G-beta repeat-containing protein [Lysobacter sp. yr284]|uniref:2OG-Fe(II) oxygenase n=1 Tax=Lysobacter sp. yr284 TaxID=1761791 RepID=UPI0008998A83|nr:2OG-Fe(II) oxygenase [Lysobacter sp. yr284]SDY86210.1 WD domain-containing protein, G-beta repeat-containing protein [Lysobacter sp. yr284]
MNAAAHTLLPLRADAASSAVGAIERPLPAWLGACALIQGFLDAAECAALIAAAESRGFAGAGGDYPPSYRNNDRQVLDDPALAQRLFERLREYAPAELTDADGARWRLRSLNERLRLCRYRPGQRFNVHQDGVHHRGPDLRSRLTFMIYLTDGDAFVGGDTLFYAHGPGRGGEADGAPLARVRPRAGALILFDHALWHAGEAVAAGVKHLLRSDLMYQRIDGHREPAQAARADAPFAPGHDGYVWTLARLRDGRIASAGRDAQVRLWSGDGREQARLRGHAQSVLGLCELPGARLATVSRDRGLRIWNLADGRCLRSEVAHDSAALCLARLGDGRLASGAADGRISVWRDDGEPLHGWAAHAGWVWSLCALGGSGLLSASEDGELAWWDAQRGERIARLHCGVALRSVDACTDTGDAWVAFAGVDGRVRIAHAADGGLRCERDWPAHDAAVRRVRWFGDGRLASCGEDGRVRVWDRDGTLLHERRHDNFATDALLLDDGRLLSCGYDRVLRTG